MYRINILLIGLILSSVVYSQHQTTNSSNTITMDTIRVTPDFEKFDFARFNKIVHPGRISASDSLANGTLIFMENLTKVLRYAEVYPDSYFCLLKNYYPNGNIGAKGLAFNHHEFAKGVWYYFNEQGELTKTVDYDKPFKFSFEQVLKFCEKEGIRYNKGHIVYIGSYKPDLRRYYTPETGECYWEIERLMNTRDKVETIKLDGVTGKVISRCISSN